ncbi:Elongator complex protein 5 [Staphylotrichum tortipilum]|uniref:Elongator complex protein 5 n=1 Tax=Staphylotrichum tortipilum TaxID=2831512 RepID=A0AAN6MQU8_9PEZI|nr:Elongator complex protein 5 [Staphylotrichum longicolle]
MAPSAQAHKRAHSLLLFEKLLNLRDTASPLTLVLDTLEQSAEPLTHEFMRRAKVERAKVIFVAFATLKKPALADIFIKARGKSLQALAAEISSHTTPTPSPQPTQKSLIILDTLTTPPTPSLLPTFFASIISAATSLLAVSHTDVPPLPSLSTNEYAPHPLTLLTHLATTVLRVVSLAHAAAARRARERSLPEPGWGLREGREGVLVGLSSAKGEDGAGGMEMRRRSGRAVAERFVMTTAPAAGEGGKWVRVVVMGDHPVFREGDKEEGEGVEEEMGATFSLGLTEKQRRDREGVVLPYFDAQVEVGGGEGGRILYDIGREDDFDEEEDEI